MLKTISFFAILLTSQIANAGVRPLSDPGNIAVVNGTTVTATNCLQTGSSGDVLKAGACANSRVGVLNTNPQTALHVSGVAVSSQSFAGTTTLNSDLTNVVSGAKPAIVGQSESGNHDGLVVISTGANASGARWSCVKTRSTSGNDSDTASQNGDEVCVWRMWTPDTGGSYRAVAQIDSLVAAAPGVNYVPGKLMLKTAPGVNSDPREAIVLDHNQSAKIGYGAAASTFSAGTLTVPYGVFATTFTYLDGTINAKDSDVASPFTDLFDANTYGFTDPLSATAGGLRVTGISDADASALVLRGLIGSTAPTDTRAAVEIRGGKNSAATSAALDSNDTILTVEDHNGSNVYVAVNGTGTVTGFNQPGVRARLSANQSIPNATETEIYFGVDDYDRQDAHNVTSSSSVFTASAAGLYFVQCRISWASSATGDRQIILRVNGTAKGQQYNATVLTGNFHQSIQEVLSLNNGDSVKCSVLQSSTGNLNVAGGEAETIFNMVKLW